MALTVSSVYAGVSGFIEFRFLFDSVAYTFLILALLFRRWYLVFLMVFLAAWTDERALIASSFIFLYHLSLRGYDLKSLFRELLNPTVIAVLAAWGAYFILRFWLSHSCGFKTDAGGVNDFLTHANNLAIGLWTGLEGAWIFVLAGIIGLILKKNYIFAFAFILCCCVSAFVAMSVADITRSMAYLLPAVFIGVRVLSKTENPGEMKKYFFTAFLISFLWPCYYVGGKEFIWWYAPPLPLQIIRIIKGT
jgi:hypothetical protein